MPLDEILFECEEHMEKAVEHLKHELRGIRTGRASTALVENVKVDYYGSPTDLRSIASITVPEATQILIKPFSPQDLKAIERAISDSKINATPHSDGKSVRLVLPPMSQETRLKMVGACKQHAETAKVAVRNVRRDANRHIEAEKKDGTLSEDDAKSGEEQVQALTKTYETKIEEMIEHKRKEVMEV